MSILGWQGLCLTDSLTIDNLRNSIPSFEMSLAAIVQKIELVDHTLVLSLFPVSEIHYLCCHTFGLSKNHGQDELEESEKL